MTYTRVLTMKRVVLAGLCAGAVALSTGVVPLSATPEPGRTLHITKECTEWVGNPGDWCTVTVSNVGRLPVGSRIYYDQAAGIPAGLLDSNIVIDAGNGNRAVGRCTLDLATGLGLCTISDGTGELAGFEARVAVTCPGGPDCDWDGTYGINPGRD
jgi:hypothetical protein